MDIFIHIFTNIIFPVFLIMAIGMMIHWKYKLDLYTLAKINLQFVIPALILTKMYRTTLSFNTFLYVISFFIIYTILIYIVTYFIFRFSSMSKTKHKAIMNGAIFYNSGNYGISVNDLIFKSDPFAASIQIWMMVFQNIFLFTYGIFLLQKVRLSLLKTIWAYLRTPIFLSLLVGILLNVSHIKIPNPILVPLDYIANAFIAIALLTLGAQVANLKINFNEILIYLSSLNRLLIGPILALCIILLFGIEGVLAQALWIASAMPTSINSAIIAQEYQNEPEFSAQLVWFSTLFSGITVTIIMILAQMIFPLS